MKHQNNRVVQSDTPHTHYQGGMRGMAKQLEFPPDVDDFIHELCAKAILRAIRNGTYVQLEEDTQPLENVENK